MLIEVKGIENGDRATNPARKLNTRKRKEKKKTILIIRIVKIIFMNNKRIQPPSLCPRRLSVPCVVVLTGQQRHPAKDALQEPGEGGFAAGGGA